jgi:hypothetical protein
MLIYAFAAKAITHGIRGSFSSGTCWVDSRYRHGVRGFEHRAYGDRAQSPLPVAGPVRVLVVPPFVLLHGF